MLPVFSMFLTSSALNQRLNIVIFPVFPVRTQLLINVFGSEWAKINNLTMKSN